MSTSFELATISAKDLSNYFIYDYNPNFGGVPFTPDSNVALYADLVEYEKPATVNIINETINLTARIRTSRDLSEYSRLKVVI